MGLRNQVKKILTGLTIPQEYVCLESPDLVSSLSVFLSDEQAVRHANVTASHLFLGYKPLIIALPFDTHDTKSQEVRSQSKIVLNFENPDPLKPVRLSRLVLKKIGEKILEEKLLVFYEGVHGEHSFLNAVHQWVNLQRGKFRRQASNNVALPGNLIDQVRIAYSVPRVISAITVSDGSLMNMFPTDLHGSAGGKFYAGSLRIGGMANDQVEKFKKIVVAGLEASYYQQAYALGKNHMRDLQKETSFALQSSRSEKFNFPLPTGTIHYKELERINSFDAGIHRIHLYEIIHQRTVHGDKPTLSHIHQHYAQWRIDHRLDTPMLLR
ncbi:MAG TPA: hypothetical protein VKQ08_01105 [Cyclobacteriaceae bacterium]|nr:hypothetical protein [Cyclobacteriaceae bacterium]